MTNIKSIKYRMDIQHIVDVVLLAMITMVFWYMHENKGASGKQMYIICARANYLSTVAVMMYSAASLVQKFGIGHSIRFHGLHGFFQYAIDVLLAVALLIWWIGTVFGTTSNLKEKDFIYYYKLTGIIYAIALIIIVRIFVRGFGHNVQT